VWITFLHTYGDKSYNRSIKISRNFRQGRSQPVAEVLLVNKKIMKNFKKGFTLIELLVVVAIIGILASVVLASLNSARTKGSDAAIKAALSGARAQGEIFYDAGQTYLNVCTAGTNNIGPMILNAAQKLASGATVSAVAWLPGNTGVAGNAVCHDSATAWGAMVSLKSSTTDGWCVDSTGKSEQTTTVLAAGAYACP
jgi:prepilin-type N-terminal cleavage/methylation domain-containing protein